MNYIVEYNRAVEFISSIVKYSHHWVQQTNWSRKEFEEDSAKETLDFSPTKDIKDWLKSTHYYMSPFLSNDLILLSVKTFGLLDICYKLILDNDLQNYDELISTLNDVTGTELIELIYESYDTGLPLTANEELIKNKIIELYNVEVASCFIQAKRHPEEYKERLISVFKEFYELFYKPYEEKVYSFMESECTRLNELYKNNFLSLINTIGIGDYTDVLNENKKFRVFVSYYIDVGMFNFYNHDTFVMFYGYSTEKRFNSKTKQDKAKELFKALSDDKRLEILKVACKRPWYNKELADYFDLAPATLSYHINLLLDLEVLNYEPSINNRYYYKTNKENLKKIFDMALKYILS